MAEDTEKHDDPELAGLLDEPVAEAEVDAPEPEAVAAKEPEKVDPVVEKTEPKIDPKPVVEAKTEVKPDPLADELKTLTDQINADDFDPYSKDGKKIMLRRQDVSAEISGRNAAERAASDVAVWEQIEDDYGVDPRAAKKLWKETVKAIADEDGLSGRDLDLVATREFKRQLKALKAEADKKEPVKEEKKEPEKVYPKRATIQAKPGAISPGAAGTRPPAPTADALESFTKSISKDDLAGFVN